MPPIIDPGMKDYSPDIKFAVVGAGRVGVTLGVLLKRAGHTITGCSARSASSLELAARWLGCPGTTAPAHAVAGADAVIISVPDDALEAVAGKLKSAIAAGTHVIHTAGSFGLAPLSILAAKGAITLAAHPLQSIPDVESGLARVPGSWFGVTCSDDRKTWAGSFVEALGGNPLWISEDDRTLYHAAAVMASNYLVVLAALVQETGFEVGPYLPLMRGTLANVESLGPAVALTGPVARGDAGTVSRHLAVLPPTVRPAYRTLALEALRTALAAGRIEESAAAAIENLLK